MPRSTTPGCETACSPASLAARAALWWRNSLRPAAEPHRRLALGRRRQRRGEPPARAADDRPPAPFAALQPAGRLQRTTPRPPQRDDWPDASPASDEVWNPPVSVQATLIFHLPALGAERAGGRDVSERVQARTARSWSTCRPTHCRCRARFPRMRRRMVWPSADWVPARFAAGEWDHRRRNRRSAAARLSRLISSLIPSGRRRSPYLLRPPRRRNPSDSTQQALLPAPALPPQGAQPWLPVLPWRPTVPPGDATRRCRKSVFARVGRSK